MTTQVCEEFAGDKDELWTPGNYTKMSKQRAKE